MTFSRSSRVFNVPKYSPSLIKQDAALENPEEKGKDTIFLAVPSS
jgi:hypothetical protein